MLLRRNSTIILLYAKGYEPQRCVDEKAAFDRGSGFSLGPSNEPPPAHHLPRTNLPSKARESNGEDPPRLRLCQPPSPALGKVSRDLTAMKRPGDGGRSGGRETRRAKWRGGWRAAFGSNPDAVALYRIALGSTLLIELITRFRYLKPFYSDDGTLPLSLLRPKIDPLYRLICLHCRFGSLSYLRLLLSIQTLLAAMLTAGYRTRIASMGSWFLYLSLTLRNTWLNFILDRYFHHLLFYSMFLPLDRKWAVDSRKRKEDENDRSHTFVSPATIALKLLIVWLYWDAGYGKYSDPLRGWTLDAKPLPALDTYVRHTIAARYAYGLLGPEGLRYMTPTVPYAEMFSGPAALVGSFLGSKATVYAAIVLMCSVHVGIALTMRNTVLLSSVACCAWCVFLPEGAGKDLGVDSADGGDASTANGGATRAHEPWLKRHGISALIIGAFVSGSVWFETLSEQCDQSMEHVWSTLLHNRWNVFVGAEDYVTWEIAPGRLADGTVVDVWSKSDQVNWEMPGAGAPCTSTARAGRWRSYPYLAELDGEDGEVLWGYLCHEWDEANGVDRGNENRKLLRFNFFMLQADVLPNMGFSATRKRLIHSHDCLSTANFARGKDERGSEMDGGGFDFAASSQGEF
ncbi:hypothetical protein ACHAWF_008620 [Thalassiosira exigua]